MSEFITVTPQEITENTFKLIGSDWGLVTAGSREKSNTMTVSWGGAGIMWNKPVSFIFIRPQRYTFEFLEKNGCFTLSFFDESYRDALRLCGTKSGRELDKAQAAGLTTVYTDEGVPYFAEAKLVLVCRKLYAQSLNADCVIASEVLGNYNPDDWHKMYISEITAVLQKR